MAGIIASLSSSVLVTVTIMWLLKRHSSSSRMMSWALAAGTIASHLAFAAVNEFSAAESSTSTAEIWRSVATTFAQPRESSHWIVIVLLAVSVAVGFLETQRSPSTKRWKSWLWIAIFATTLLRILWGSVYLKRRWSGLESSLTIAAHSLVLTLICVSERSFVLPQRHLIRVARLLLLTLTMAAAAVVIGMSGSAVYSQLMLGATASLFAILVMELWQHVDSSEEKPERVLPTGMILLVFGYHLWLGHYFAELTQVDLILLTASIFCCFLSGFGATTRLRSLKFLLPAVACVALFATALTRAGLALTEALSQRGG